MLDFFTITTKGGLVLWTKAYGPSQSSPINNLIQEVLIEERSSTQVYYKDNYALRWTFANDLDLIFIVGSAVQPSVCGATCVAAYPKTLGLTYIDTLLKAASIQFSDLYGERILRKNSSIPQLKDWEVQFEALLQTIEDQDALSKKSKQPRKFEETFGYANTLAFSRSKPEDIKESAKSPLLDEDEFRKNVELLKKKAISPRMGGRKGKGAKSPTASPVIGTDDTKKKSIKEGRKWDGAISAKDAKSLDYSNSEASETVITDHLVDRSGMGQHDQDGTYNVADLDASDDEGSYGSNDSDEEYAVISSRSLQAKKPASTGLLSFFKSMTGQKELTDENLEPVMNKMKEHLVNKNVAANIAQHLCDSIAKGLVGQTLGSFKSIQSHVKQSMELALKRILTPKTSVDLLRDIAQAQAEKRPYTIVFIGVNGVGKSTNLSKTAFWLLQNNLKILIAACDTFRSGAVEQLRVHVRNLKALEQNAVVDLYEKGYGKDSAAIAKEAISSAKITGHDVVLIDTAGRMQDNDPLMRALAKLVTVNNPDKIIFVGEALVGNEAVDQLTKFNAALKDFSGLANPRHIDGMILTKFDTIDDKVGAALSMTYTTGQPILFVGTGQTYTDLKNMKVSHVVASLLKD
ncbi:hypothetical protein BGZ65_002274 [Modicella reniformis]|uniref:SRP54-type proteins GTP-binding domain-containing protein n=1 Tax=Modicella reniformis TaxID=1440133 RepID=A0A9P6INM2_9FUNG|nr:hypothetical protein BGZ65_002274 [Modicella reniformis]